MLYLIYTVYYAHSIAHTYNLGTFSYDYSVTKTAGSAVSIFMIHLIIFPYFVWFMVVDGLRKNITEELDRLVSYVQSVPSETLSKYPV